MPTFLSARSPVAAASLAASVAASFAASVAASVSLAASVAAAAAAAVVSGALDPPHAAKDIAIADTSASAVTFFVNLIVLSPPIQKDICCLCVFL